MECRKPSAAMGAVVDQTSMTWAPVARRAEPPHQRDQPAGPIHQNGITVSQSPGASIIVGSRQLSRRLPHHELPWTRPERNRARVFVTSESGSRSLRPSPRWPTCRLRATPRRATPAATSSSRRRDATSQTVQPPPRARRHSSRSACRRGPVGSVIPSVASACQAGEPCKAKQPE
jgi:hypothetical protein